MRRGRGCPTPDTASSRQFQWRRDTPGILHLKKGQNSTGSEEKREDQPCEHPGQSGEIPWRIIAEGNAAGGGDPTQSRSPDRNCYLEYFKLLLATK